MSSSPLAYVFWLVYIFVLSYILSNIDVGILFVYNTYGESHTKSIVYKPELLSVNINSPKDNSYTSSSTLEWSASGILLQQQPESLFRLQVSFNGRFIVFPGGNNISFTSTDKVYELNSSK